MLVGLEAYCVELLCRKCLECPAKTFSDICTAVVNVRHVSHFHVIDLFHVTCFKGLFLFGMFLIYSYFGAELVS